MTPPSDVEGETGCRLRTIEVEVNGRTRSVVVERIGSLPGRFRVSWDGVDRVVDARLVDTVTLSLVGMDGGSTSHQVRCVEVDQRGELELHVAGGAVRAVVDAGRQRFESRAGTGDIDGEQTIIAPMPGKVVRVLAQPGAEVAAHQALVVVEAMKMENELRSPRAGHVKEIPVREGMVVEAGRVLAVIE